MALINIPYKAYKDELSSSEFNQILDAIEFGNLSIKTVSVFLGDIELKLDTVADKQVLVYDSANNVVINKTLDHTYISDFDTAVSNHSDVSANTSARHTHNNKTYLDVINQELSDTSDVSFNSIEVVSAFFNSEVSTDATIDWTQGNKQSITLTADTTLTFTNPSGPCNLILKIVQDSTGGWNVTFPSNVKWEGGNAPDLSSDSGSAVRIVSMYFDGTDYYAQITEPY